MSRRGTDPDPCDTRTREKAKRWRRTLRSLYNLRGNRDRMTRGIERLERRIAAKEIELSALFLGII